MKRFLLISLLTFIYASDAFALTRAQTRWLGNQRRSGKLQDGYKEYSYDSCKQYNSTEEESYFVSCDEEKGIQYHPLNVDNISSMQLPATLLRKADTEEYLLKKLKSELTEKMKEQFHKLSLHYECLKYANTATRQSPYCSNIVNGYLKSTQEYLPQMRESMAIAQTPPAHLYGTSYYGTYGGTLSPVRVEESIEHENFDHEIDELTDKEKTNILADKTKARALIQDKFFEEYKSNNPNSPCAVSSFQELKPACRIQMSSSLYQYTIEKDKEVIGEAKDYYDRIISQYPHLPYITKATLPEKKADQVTMMKDAVKNLYDQAKEQFEHWKDAPLEDYQSFFHYPQVIENIYKNKITHDKYQCDVLEDLHQDYGPGGNKEFYRNIGIALGTLAGGGLCLFTGGIACALGVAIVGEALTLAPEAQQLSFSKELFRNQIISREEVATDGDQLTLSVAMAPLSFVGLKGTQAIRNSTGKVVARETAAVGHELIEIPQVLGASQLKRLVAYQGSRPDQNRRWIELAAKGRSGRTLFFDVENAAIKKLNDSLGDKNLVTSLTNLHKVMMKKEVDEWLKKYPDLNVELYSDFKSLRFAIDGDVTPAIKEQMKKEFAELMSKVNSDFEKSVRSMDSEYKDVLSEAGSWFKGGMGETADEAGLAARRARRNSDSVVDIKTVKSSIQADLRSIERTRKYLLQKLPNELVDQQNGIPNLDVMEYIRKKGKTFEGDPEKFIKQFEERFNVKLSNNEAKDLVGYIDQVDQFSPGLWIEERVVANLDEAEFGGFSADFKGMGARNLQQVAIDLSRNSNSVDNALASLRQGEKIVTESFDEGKNFYRDVITKTLKEDGIETKNFCSGDDCVSLPTKPLPDLTKEKIMRSLGQYGSPDAQRLSFIPPGIQSRERTLLAVHGELMEKQVRSQLTGFGPDQLSPEVLRKVGFALDMPAEVGKGNPRLMISTAPGVSLNASEKAAIEKAYSEIMDQVNRNILEETGKQTSYDAGQLIFVTQ